MKRIIGPMTLVLAPCAIFALAACTDTELPEEDSKVIDQLDFTVDMLPQDTAPDAGIDMAPDLTPDVGADMMPPDMGIDMPPDLGVDMPPKPDSDVTGPAVKSTIPTSNQTGVALSTKVSAVFTEPIAPATITSASFLLKLSTLSIPGATGAAASTATLTPTRPLCPLRKYDATLKKTITDLAANPLVADYPWSFTTGDGKWDAPKVAPKNSSGVRPAMAQNGDAFVIWTTPAPSSLRASRFDAAAGTWGAAATLNNATTSLASGDIAADAAGNAVAIWRQASSADLLGARYDATKKTWGAPAALEAATGYIGYPRVAMSPAGAAMVVFTQDTTSSTGAVYYNYFDGAAWSGRKPIPGPGIRPYRYVRVASDGLGNFFATWIDRIGSGDYTLRASRFDGKAKTWSAASTVLATKASSYNHQLSAGPAGAFAIWQARPQATYLIAAARFAGTSWGAPKTLSSGTAYATSPTVATDLSGDALAAWYQGSVKYSAYAKTTSSWSAAAVIAANGHEPSAVLDAAGNGFLLWGEDATNGDRVRVARWIGATKIFQPAAWLAPARQGYMYSVIPVAANACGQVAAIWEYDNEGSVDPPDYVLFR